MYTRIDADPRTFYWGDPNGVAGVFRGAGGMRRVGDPHEPPKADPHFAARFFIGLQVAQGPQHTVEELIGVLAELRGRHGRAADGNFFVEPGVLSRHPRGQPLGRVVVEGAQVIFVSHRANAEKRFGAEMVTWAEELAAALGQNEIVVEIQRNGLHVQTMGVVPVALTDNDKVAGVN